MLIGIYVFARIMIKNTFLNVKKNRDGGGEHNNEIVEENFKLVASVLYYIFMQVVDKMMENYERLPDKPGNDYYSDLVYKYSAIKKFFDKNEQCRNFITSMKILIEEFLHRLHLLVTNAEQIQEKYKQVE